MSQIDIRREYADGDVLLASDLDAIVDDVETFINTTKLNDDNIQNSGITASDKLIDASISTAKLASSSVTAVKIASDAVTTAKILDANVTAAKLATDSVTTAKILDANVTTAKINDGAVTTAKLASGAKATIQSQSFSESGTLTAPAGVTSAIVYGVVGGGGGGGGAGKTKNQGGGTAATG